MKQKSLTYHKFPFPGKIYTKIKDINQKTFSLAYTPGVAFPCLEIEQDPQKAYDFTSKGNQVAIISNGTAVLGLGNIGALASKPVMEGKAMLLKYLAGIDAIDIEVEVKNKTELIKTIKNISNTFGAINLEDISAPDCFEVEKKLSNQLNIPVFHDDQHGTAITIVAAIKNALILISKQMQDVKIIIKGAGAAALATANFLVTMKAKKKNIFIFDSKGLITYETNSKYKKKFAQDKSISFKEAMNEADIFIGLSKGNTVFEEDIKNMANNPIILALANPTPEIMPEIIKKIRPDAIIGTGRPDFPNQINNVLCFPFIFRAALDIQAKKITKKMKIACCKAIANIAHSDKKFSKDHIVPDIWDPTLIYKIPKAIIKAAIEEKIAQKTIPENYLQFLDEKIYETIISSPLMIPKTNSQELLNLLKIKGADKKIDKNFYIINEEEVINKINELNKEQNGFEIFFEHFNLKIDELKFEITQMIKNNKIIGIIDKKNIFFNSNFRIFYALKLLEDK